jgi:hypothetical protein
MDIDGIRKKGWFNRPLQCYHGAFVSGVVGSKVLDLSFLMKLLLHHLLFPRFRVFNSSITNPSCETH